jgi:hypothetical protein
MDDTTPSMPELDGSSKEFGITVSYAHNCLDTQCLDFYTRAINKLVVITSHHQNIIQRKEKEMAPNNLTIEELFALKDDFHKKIDEAFASLESNLPEHKGVNVDVPVDILRDAWKLWKDGIAEISKLAGELYAENVDQA